MELPLNIIYPNVYTASFIDAGQDTLLAYSFVMPAPSISDNPFGKLDILLAAWKTTKMDTEQFQ